MAQQSESRSGRVVECFSEVGVGGVFGTSHLFTCGFVADDKRQWFGTLGRRCPEGVAGGCQKRLQRQSRHDGFRSRCQLVIYGLVHCAEYRV